MVALRAAALGQQGLSCGAGLEGARRRSALPQLWSCGMSALLLQLAGLGVALAAAVLILVRPWWSSGLRASPPHFPLVFGSLAFRSPEILDPFFAPMDLV